MKSSTYFGALSIGLALALAVFGCEGEIPDTTTEIEVERVGLPEGLTVEKFARTVPSLKIIKATDEYVLVGYEVPKNQNPDTAIKAASTTSSAFTLSDYIDYGSNLFDPSDNKTYRAGRISYPGGDVSVKFVSSYTKTTLIGSDGSVTVQTDTDAEITKTVFFTVKMGNFKTKSASYTIPDVTEKQVTVYSGNPKESNYNAALGLNERRIVVTLPTDGIAKYLRYRINYGTDEGSTRHVSDECLNGKAYFDVPLDGNRTVTVDLKFATSTDGYTDYSSNNKYTPSLGSYELFDPTTGFSITN